MTDAPLNPVRDEDRRLIIAAVGDAAEFEDIAAGPCIILRGSVEAVRAAAVALASAKKEA